jgi:hypothetical protein
METLEKNRESDGAKLNDEGRYCVEIEPGLFAYGYRTHFTGAWICYNCGHLCECGEGE